MASGSARHRRRVGAPRVGMGMNGSPVDLRCVAEGRRASAEPRLPGVREERNGAAEKVIAPRTRWRELAISVPATNALVA